MKTIIDILKRGNLELFHSSMIAWLMSPIGEHGLKQRFLCKLLEKTNLSSEEYSWANEGRYRIATEIVDGRNRYDIAAIVDGHRQLVIENKTKSIGCEDQPELYRNSNSQVLLLGLTKYSFSEAAIDEFPLVTYSQVMEALQSVSVPVSSSFGVLITEYLAFLSDQIGLLNEVERVYGPFGNTDEASRNALALRISNELTEDNDQRFVALTILEQFRRHLGDQSTWRRVTWESNKNNISGVWLANPNGLEDSFEFAGQLAEQLAKYEDAHLWFHIEISNLAASCDDMEVGNIQLRCSSKSRIKELVSDIVRATEPEEGDVTNQRARGGSSYVLRRPICRRELPARYLSRVVTNFHNRFGSFRHHPE